MNDYALYFMPDISGFTEFVNSTEIEHSKHIISELLEILLDANTLDLKLAEVEGDALFMYTESPPTFQELLAQTKFMLNKFSNHLQLYNLARICDCGACSKAQNLEVKFIIHYGKISFIRVKDIIKPYGSDVIKIHRFLKNSIPSDQYLLLSQDTVDYYESNSDIDISEFVKKEDIYDFGTSQYHYDEMSRFITPFTPQNIIITKPSSEPQMKFEVVFENEMSEVHAFISDFSQRSRWYKLVDKIDFDEYRINRAGTEHNCIAGENIFKVETLKWKLKPNQLGYGERTKGVPGLREYQHYFTFSKSGNKTVLNIAIYLEYENELDTPENEQMTARFTAGWNESLKILQEIMANQIKE